MKNILEIVIREGDRIPPFWGIAFFTYHRGIMGAACYPLPLNFLLALFRPAYIAMKNPYWNGLRRSFDRRSP